MVALNRILVVCFAFFSLLGISQTYNFKRLSVEEGLSQPGLYSIAEGPEGKLWIGLENAGVVTYDGWGFSSIDPTYTGLDIRSIYKSSEDEMWVGSSFDGISVFEKDSVITLNVDNGLKSNHIRSIVEDVEGKIWVSTISGGISVFSDKELVKTFEIKDGLPSLNSRAIISSEDGRVWAGTDKGLLLFDDLKILKKYTKNNGLLSSKILSLAKDAYGNILVGTNNGLNIITKDSIYSFDDSSILKQKRVKSILVGHDNTVWIGSKEGVGMLHYRSNISKGIQVKWFTEENGLSNNRIRCLYQDASKAIWIGTYFGGINRFFNSTFSLTTKRNNLSNNAIRSVEYEDSSYWIGTFGSGLDVISPQIYYHVDADHGLSNNTVTCIASIGKEAALIGTDDGINLVKEGEVIEVWDSYSDAFNGAKITNVVNNAGKAIALTEKHELIVFDTHDPVSINKALTVKVNELIHKGTTKEQSRITEVHSVSLSDDKFWIGTKKQLYSFRIDSSGFEGLNSYLIPDVESIAKLKDSFIGYDVHDSVFVFDQSGVVLWKRLLKGVESIKFLVKQSENSFWLGQNKSVTNLRISNGKVELIKNFGIDEGFLGIQPFHNSAVLSQGRNVLVGSIKGLLKIDSSNYHGVKRDLSVSLKRVLLNGDVKDWKAHADEIKDGVPVGLKLLHNHVNLTFQVNSVHLKNPHEISFKYKLEGWDDEYRIRSANLLKSDDGLFNIDYEHIAPGEFELIVYAKTPHGDWSSEPLKYKFEILQVWWKTTSFIVSSILVLIGLIVFLVMYRTERLVKEKLKLEGLVQDRTKDLNEEKIKSEKLLLNILPSEIALELKTFGSSKAKKYAKASVLFTDFKGFTKLSTEMSAVELVEKLDEIFVAFDEVIERNNLEKIKTIGDAYMCASGVPNENAFQVKNIVIAGLQLVEVMNSFNRKQESLNQPVWDVRVGIHTGEIIAGVVGKKKFAYDVWGDTVNIASRMESNSEPGRVNVSVSTFKEVERFFEFESRGYIQAKNCGELEMFFVNRIKDEFCKNDSTVFPNQRMFKKD